MSSSKLVDVIALAFIESAKRDSFNGVVASTLFRIEANEEDLKASLASLIEQKRITAVFSRWDVNIHIKRLHDLPIEQQLAFLESESLKEFALYPTESEVRQRVDLTAWQDRPFTQALLLAEPQFTFERSTLEHSSDMSLTLATQSNFTTT